MERLETSMEKLPKKSLAERTADKIFDMITTERLFSHGDKLPNENELAQSLGVSRITLREAIRILAAQGVLEVKRGLGTFIAEGANMGGFGIHRLEKLRIRLRDLFEVRLMFEPQTAALACERATAADIEHIAELSDQVESLIHKGKPWTDTDSLFHTAILTGAGNEFMTQLIPLINRAITDAWLLYGSDPNLAEFTLRDNRLIVEMLKNRDIVGVRHAVSIHIRHTIHALELDFGKNILE
jgi:DNA-binding FadR family transcriptional regulator